MKRDKRSVEEIDNMTAEEREKNLIFFKDFKKMQTIEDLSQIMQ